MPQTQPSVVVLDLGSDDLSELVGALEETGAVVEVTDGRDAIMSADGLIVTGDNGAEAAMVRLRAARGDELIERRLSGGRPVLGIGTGMNILFDAVAESGTQIDTLAQWPGTIRSIEGVALVEPTAIDVAPGSALFDGIENELFIINSPYAATEWTLEVYGAFQPPKVSYATNGERLIAAVENGPLSAVQFHPELSGAAGRQLLRNWLNTL